MNKTLILSCIFLLVLSSFAIAVDTGNLTETNENITLYFDNTGTLTKNYPGFFNVTWNSSQGWAKVNNGSVIVTYNVSSGESWALYQDPTTCVMPYDEYQPISPKQICRAIYYVNDSASDGFIRVKTGGKIDCNGAKFIGKQGFAIASRYGTTENNEIKNCIFENFTAGAIKTPFIHSSVHDNSFINNKIYVLDSYNLTISNNNFTGNLTSGIFGFRGVKNTYFLYNKFENIANGIQLQGNTALSGNNTFIGNIFINTTNEVASYGIATTVTVNSIFENNSFNYTDIGIQIDNGNTATFSGNIFDNINQDGDNYDLPIRINNYDNTILKNNSFLKISTDAIFIFNSSNYLINKNYYDYLNITEKYALPNRIHDYGDVPCAINIIHIYKSLSGSYNATIAGNPIVSSDNYTITENIFDSDTQCFLRTAFATNVTHDFSNYWYRSFGLTNFSLRNEFYLSNNFDIINNNYNAQNTTNLYLGYPSISGQFLRFGLSKSIMNFTSTGTYQLNLYNLTPPYNDIRINGVVSALNQPNYSITLNPGDLVEVSDFTYCGDGIVQSPNDNSSFMEDCDGANLNSQTCLSVGFTKGTLSCNSCSFVTTDCQAKSQLCQDNLVPLSGMTTWLGLLVTIICIAFVFIIFTDNSINIKMEGNTFYTTVLIIISVGFLIGVGILILSNLC